MEATIQHVISSPINGETTQVNVLNRFFQWCTGQEKYRFGWLAAALAVHGCILTPITLFAIVLGGNQFIFWMLALIAMGASLVTNLAALPTKITIPTFFISIILDVAIIATCLINIL